MNVPLALIALLWLRCSVSQDKRREHVDESSKLYVAVLSIGGEGLRSMV